MKIKTSELTGAALDWAVELAKGTYWSANGYFVFKNPDGTTRTFERNPEWRYSTDWSQGGPLIEREKIDVAFTEDGWYANMYNRMLDNTEGYIGNTFRCGGDGPTPLIAAMRCFAASELGDEVEIPPELLT